MGAMRPLHMLQTAVCAAGFVVLGLLVGAIGPALPTLKQSLGGGTSYRALGVVFVARGAGSLGGSAVAGYLLDRTSHGNALLAGGLVVAAIGGGLIPISPNVFLLLSAVFIMDSGLGVVIACGNTLCTWANRTNPTPALNVLNGAFGVGAFAAPLIMLTFERLPRSKDDDRQTLVWSFWSIALFAACMGAGVSLVPSPVHPSKHATAADAEAPQGWAGQVLVVELTALYVMLVVGAEISFGAFMVPYVVEKRNQGGFDMSKREAEVMNSVFWIVFTLSRFLWGGLSVLLAPHLILMSEMTILVVSVTLMALWPFPSMLWVGAVAFGIGMAGCFAAAVGQMQERVGMTGSAGGWVAAGASCATFVQLITAEVAHDPDQILYCTASAILGSVGIMALLWVLNGLSEHSNHVLIQRSEACNIQMRRSICEHNIESDAHKAMTPFPAVERATLRHATPDPSSSIGSRRETVDIVADETAFLLDAEPQPVDLCTASVIVADN